MSLQNTTNSNNKAKSKRRKKRKRPAQRSIGKQLTRWYGTTSMILRFGRRHRSTFLWGSIWAVVVVVMRLALPWPFKSLLELLLTGGEGNAGAPPGIGSHILLLGGIFFLLLVALGFADHLERLCFARFTIGTVRDLRQAAIHQALESRLAGTEQRSGDLVARLIGDTARIKTGLKGFLVHVATNGLSFLGVIIVLMWLNTGLGLVFAAAGVLIAIVTALGASRIYQRALRYRRKEGKLADRIQRSWADRSMDDSFTRLNDSSGRHEAALSRIQGLTTWSAHALFGIAVFCSLWIGVESVQTGELTISEFILFIFYALGLRAPVVQLSRQGARTGKILASGERIARLLRRTDQSDHHSIGLAPLAKEIRLQSLKILSGKGVRRRRILGPLDVTVGVGQSIALIGPCGSGKSTFLQVLAGLRRPSYGSISWDDCALAAQPGQLSLPGLHYLSRSPTWPRRDLCEFLDIAGRERKKKTRQTLRLTGVREIVKRLRGGLDAHIGANDLSPGERTMVALARLLLRSTPVLLLDDPVAALDTAAARKVVGRILRSKRCDTLIIAMSRAVMIDRFDRVIELQRGRIRFDGASCDWRRDSRTLKDADTSTDRIARSRSSPE